MMATAADISAAAEEAEEDASFEGMTKYSSSSGLAKRREQGLSFLRWAQAHSAVATTKFDVPDGILPPGRSAVLHDLRIFSKRRGPDDAVYDRHEDLRQRLARGNTVLELQGGPEAGFYTALRALRKFTGGDPWDDDDRCDAGDTQQDAWARYFAKPASEATRVISTAKANGESAHLSAFRIDNEFFLVGGSKNTHMLVRGKDDVMHYTADRFRVARIFMKVICDALDELGAEKKQQLLSFLWSHSLTAVFEILMQDHQHVENLSHIGRPAVLKFIAWTDNEDKANLSFTAMPPDEGFQMAQRFGLSPIHWECLMPDEVNAYTQKMIRQHGKEGVVLYFLDAANTTVGLLKKKTAWYVLCRAIREKAKMTLAALRRHPAKFSLSEFQTKTEKRLDSIEQWLKLPREVTMRWKVLANGFLEFACRGFRAEEVRFEEVADMFPVVWQRYLDERSLDDRVFRDNAEES